uniref:40S ribosomal protein S15-4 n=1 Tax=Tanacetum cinerariifolium TaxID=118510 RepID=A0A699HLT9_TANCI|nr:40S ribosomal protein S15-4 [Tanacetum cinerariifolium]
MEGQEPDVAVAKKRTFKKFSFRGVDLDALLDMSTDELVKMFTARARRRFHRGLKRKPMALIKKLRKAKREAPAGEKPNLVKTHLRNMIIVPEMIGSVVGVYNGKTFNQIEIKPEMIGHYLAEFSISYKPVKHGRPDVTDAAKIVMSNGKKKDWDWVGLGHSGGSKSKEDCIPAIYYSLAKNWSIPAKDWITEHSKVGRKGGWVRRRSGIREEMKGNQTKRDEGNGTGGQRMGKAME